MAFSALLACGFLAVLQATAPTISIGEGTIQPGATVSVPITLQANGTAPASMAAWVHFDAARFQYVSVAQGAAATAAQKTVSGNVPESGILHIVIWGPNATAAGDGVLGTISFTALPLTPLGDYALTVTNDSIADSDANPIAHAQVNGVIHVKAAGEGEGEGENTGGCFGGTVKPGDGAGQGSWPMLACALALALATACRKATLRAS